MFVETSAAIIVLAPILAPVAVHFGIDPIHFGLIMIVNLALGMITPPVGVSELARLAGLPKSTAFRFLADLEKVGFVERDGSDYRLGIPLFELGNKVPVCRPNGLRDAAMHELSQLHLRTGLSVHLGVLEGTDIVHVAKVNHSVQTLPGHLLPGSRRPATCSALGKAIVAHSPKETLRGVVEAGLERRTPYSITEPPRLLRDLAKVRETGLAHEREESVRGLIGLAAPIMLDGRPVGAVGVTLRAPATLTARHAADVRAAARIISQRHAELIYETW